MKMKMTHLARPLVLAVLALGGLQFQHAVLADTDTLSQAEYFKLADMRYEALHGDRTHVSQMIAALHSRHAAYVITALHALAHLGATEALPDIDEVMQTYPAGSYLHTQAKVFAARLQAEADLPAAPAATPLTPASTAATALTSAQRAGVERRAQDKVKLFLTHLDMTPQQVQTGAATFVQHKQRLRAEGRQNEDADPETLVAIQQIADILYHEPGVTAQVRQAFPDMDFTMNFPSDLKIRLAPRSRKERIAWLINDLAQKKMLGVDSDCEIQLAVDEGLDASNAAAAKLKEMEGHRDKFSRNGFTALFDVLDGVGDKAQVPLIKHFVYGKDVDLQYYAASHGGVAGGHRYQYMTGY